MLIYDDRGRAIPGNPTVASGPLTTTVAALAGLHSIDVPIEGGRVRLVPDMRGVVRLFAALLVIDVLCGALAGFFGRRAVRRILTQAMQPLHATTAALERLADGDLSDRVVATQADEVGRLAVAYNKAAANLRRAFAERNLAYTEMRRFVADAGHELRTPLTVIIGYLDALRDDVVKRPAERRAVIATIAAQSERLRNLVNGLIRLAQIDEQPSRAVEPIPLRNVVDGVVDGLPEAWRNRVRDDGGEAYAAIALESCVAVVRNVVDNAARYTSGPVVIRIDADPDAASIVVRDDGPGMTAEESARAFDRFYRATRETSEEGSGLGLSIVKRAVEIAGGSVTIASSPGAGTTVSIRLPRA